MDTRARIALKDNAAFWDGANPAEELSDFDGLDRYEARELVITLAEAQGWLDGIDAETHMVPHADRSKVAVEPFLTDQWYVDAATLAKPALEAVRDGRTRILPERDEKTYFHWLENIEPWCISRQLWWGHRIPVWYGDYADIATGQAPSHFTRERSAAGDEEWTSPEHGALDCRPSAASSVELVRVGCRKLCIERAWATRHRPLRGRAGGRGRRVPGGRSTQVRHTRRDPDVLDTWFSSGIWPIGTLGWPEDTPGASRAITRQRRWSPGSTSSSSGSRG